MNRFRLVRSDMPLRARQLPLYPGRIPRHGFDLEQGTFHKVLVALDQQLAPQRIVWFVLLAALDFALSLAIGVVPAVALAVAQLCDWLILTWLPRRRISFGPVPPQWLTLAALRIVGALVIALFNADVVSVVAQLLGVGLVAYGFALAPSRIGLSRITLAVPAIPCGERVRLLHVADVHLERHGVREEQLLALARATQPDLILFTGDFLNLSYVHDAVAQQQSTSLWRALSDIAPIYAVSGSPPVDPQPVVAKILADTPVTWLRNEQRCLSVRGSHLHIVGVTCTHDPWKDGDTLRRVINQPYNNPNNNPTTQPPNHPTTILLYHAPDLAPQAAALGAIDLHLAGHTHGGQVRLPIFGALIAGSLYHKQLEMGLYPLREMLLFVSRGVGLEGKGAPRVRFLCPPEVALIELQGEA